MISAESEKTAVTTSFSKPIVSHSVHSYGELQMCILCASQTAPADKNLTAQAHIWVKLQTDQWKQGHGPFLKSCWLTEGGKEE